jgi:NAD(P)-dependent dehydrogenase (short-subunit alcohol dehydrogenase family)
MSAESEIDFSFVRSGEMGKLAGRVAVITGANSGIGLASPTRFAEEGAKVFMTGRRQAQLDEAVRSVGRGAVGVRGDIAKGADLDHLYDVVKEQAGVIDVLFANAGGGEFRQLAELTEEHFDRTFHANVRARCSSARRRCLCCGTARRSS